MIRDNGPDLQRSTHTLQRFSGPFNFKMQENTETKSFVLYDSYYEAAEELGMDCTAIGKFVMLLRDYAIKGVERRSEDGRVNALLATAKPKKKRMSAEPGRGR